MKSTANTKSSMKQTATQQAAVAVPMTKLAGLDMSRENSQLELLTRLTEASIVIRSEAERIKAIGVSDRSVRLLRILGEAIEEQRIGFGAEKTK